MHEHPFPNLTGLAPINGLGMGILLAAHQEIEESYAIWAASLEPPPSAACVLSIDVRFPLVWFIVPVLTTIGVSLVASKLFATLSQMSKFSLWSWVLVGITSLIIVVPLMLNISTYRSLFYAGYYSEVIRICSVVLFYEVWFGLVLVLARKNDSGPATEVNGLHYMAADEATSVKPTTQPVTVRTTR